MIFSFTRVLKSIQLFPQIFSQFFIVLIGMHFINFSFNQSMIYMQELRMSSKSDDYIVYMFAIAFVGFVCQALIKVLWTLIICHFHQKKKLSLMAFLKNHTELGLIESLRAFFKAILWGFLFIIPGLFKMIRYQFVLFNVALSDNYEKGELDALEGSENLSRGHLIGLTFLILIFSVLSFMTNSEVLFVTHPFSVLSLEVLSFVLLTVETTYLLLLFLDLQKKKGLS